MDYDRWWVSSSRPTDRDIQKICNKVKIETSKIYFKIRFSSYREKLSPISRNELHSGREIIFHLIKKYFSHQF